MKNLFLTIFATLLLYGCDEKMVTIPDFVPPTSDRVILMEEFTGASCPNCPAGAEATEGLLSLFPDNLVAVAIHSNFLAWPAKPGDLDLRIPAADEIETFLGQWISKPEASFNRKLFIDRGEQNIRVGTFPDAWINFVEDELETFARVYVDIESNYDPATREVNIQVTGTAQENLPTGDYRVNVMISESGIITSQKDGSEVIEKFKQKHALRALLTNVGGEAFFTSLGSGLQREAFFSFTLPDEEALGWWVPENCTVIAFITDGATKEVMQAGEVHLVQ